MAGALLDIDQHIDLARFNDPVNPILHGLAEQEDGVEGCAQFMADHGQEFIFGAQR